MSKEKQKFFRLSAFNCDRSQGPNPLSPRASGEGSKKSKSESNSMIRLGVKVSKLSDTSDDDDDDDDDQNSADSAVASAAGGGGASSHPGKSGATQKESKRNGDVNERLSDSSSSCSSSNDSSSSSDSCSDDDSSDDSDEDSSSLSSNSSLSSSYEPDPGAKPPGGAGGGGGSSGKGHDKFSSKKGSLNFDSSLSLQKKSANAGGGSSRGTFSFTDFSEKNESDGVWGFAAEAKKSAEIFSTPPSNSTANERVFGSFAEDEKGAAGSSSGSGTAAGNKTPASSRGRKPAQREVMKETRNTFNRDFAGTETPSAIKRRISKAQSDSNNNTNAASKKAVASVETKRKGGDVVAATPRAALNESAANDNFVSPSCSGSRATTTSSPPYSIYGQNSIGKDAIPITSQRD